MCAAGLYVLYDDGKNVRLLYELEVPLYPQVTLPTPLHLSNDCMPCYKQYWCWLAATDEGLM